MNKNKQLFFSHTWRPDNLGRNTHCRVHELVKKMRENGWTTWFDEEDMGGNIDAAMAEGIEKADAILVCLTETYCKKVNETAKNPRNRDNCLKEWTYANARNKLLIPVIMEPCLLDMNSWPPGIVSLYLGSTLYINASDDDLSEGIIYANKFLLNHGLIPNNKTQKLFINIINKPKNKESPPKSKPKESSPRSKESSQKSKESSPKNISNIIQEKSILKLPIIKSPITKSPITKSPITKSPITKSPITKSPITKSPITKSLITKSPITKSPNSSPKLPRPPANKPNQQLLFRKNHPKQHRSPPCPPQAQISQNNSKKLTNKIVENEEKNQRNEEKNQRNEENNQRNEENNQRNEENNQVNSYIMSHAQPPESIIRRISEINVFPNNLQNKIYKKSKSTGNFLNLCI
jgi:hypothetical protein